jgi:para-aminobenzoate synthetase component 1
MGRYYYSWGFSVHALKAQVLKELEHYDTYAFLDTNGFYNDQAAQAAPVYSTYELVVGAGRQVELSPDTDNQFEELRAWVDQQQQWYFGHLGYDLKNGLENLSSQNYDYHGFPDLYGFVPEWVLTLQNGLIILYADSQKQADAIYARLQPATDSFDQNNKPPATQEIRFQGELSRTDYVKRVASLIDHIIAGDIYEVNFCQAFYAHDVELDPIQLYKVLMAVTPTPFSCLYKFRGAYVVSASMERFMTKFQDKLVSQPIKGTAKRGLSAAEDQAQATHLRSDEKERAENVMIVDLVRNDLAKSAQTGSVKVDELFGIYPFPTVHQMISTVSALKAENVHSIDALQHAFPMGSMTGAPKVRAMQLIERYEASKRGIFSGAIGYITPWQDFDFNVVIRSFLYNTQTKTLTLPVGSAITYDADPEQEYEECMVKIEKLKRCLYQPPATAGKTEKA